MVVKFLVRINTIEDKIFAQRKFWGFTVSRLNQISLFWKMFGTEASAKNSFWQNKRSLGPLFCNFDQIVKLKWLKSFSAA